MAHFKAEINNGKSSVSRLGHKTAGIVTTTAGWGSGVDIEAVYDGDTKQDIFVVYATGGSNQPGDRHLLGRLIGGVWHPRTAEEDGQEDGQEDRRLFLCELIEGGVVLVRFYRDGRNPAQVKQDLELYQWPAGTWRITPTTD